MEILNKPVLHQCKLALRHVTRILQAMDENLNFSSIFQACCYVTSVDMVENIVSLWSYITDNENASVNVVVVNELPRNAQMEWEIVASNLDNLQGIFNSNNDLKFFFLSSQEWIRFCFSYRSNKTP